MKDITQTLGLDEDTIFDNVKAYARSLKDNWNIITQASKETKIPISSISANCYEQRGKTNGYVFKFKFLGDDK